MSQTKKTTIHFDNTDNGKMYCPECDKYVDPDESCEYGGETYRCPHCHEKLGEYDPKARAMAYGIW